MIGLATPVRAWLGPDGFVLAIHEQLDGKTVDWLEHVSDEQYRAG